MSSSTGISELVRNLTAVQRRVERMKLPEVRHSRTDDTTPNILLHDKIEQFWKKFMKPFSLRFRDYLVEHVHTSVSQGIAPVPGEQHSTHTSWQTTTIYAAIRAFMFILAFVMVQWVISPYVLDWTKRVSGFVLYVPVDNHRTLNAFWWNTGTVIIDSQLDGRCGLLDLSGNDWYLWYLFV